MPVKIFVFIACFISGIYAYSQPAIKLSVNGLNRLQTIDGIGVNINTRSWKDDELKPAIDLLADSMQAKIFRVIVETPKEWEDSNDNDDPFVYNWKYYDSLYATPKFTSVWKTIAYLNQKGISHNIMINLMGYLPEWMGGETVAPEQEDEFVEMFVSFLQYARFKQHLKFGLVAPFNEPDIQKEGPRLNESRYVAILKKIMIRTKQSGMNDIRFVGPDAAGMNNAVSRYIPEMMKDPLIMSHISRFAVHSYGGYYAPVDSLIKHSAFPGLKFWVTEWNAWRDGLDDGIMTAYNYQFAAQCMGYLLELLKNGAAAAMVWEGYDSYYDHHAPSLFSYWGILGYNKENKTYTPRKHFYAISQISKYVTPGSWMVESQSSDSNAKALAFFNSSGNAPVIVGLNPYNKAVQINLSLNNLPDITSVQLIYTDSLNDLKKQKTYFPDKKGKFTIQVPANCIYTLVADTGVPVNAGSLNDRLKKKGWYAGDIHVHRNCGEGTPIYSVDTLASAMKKNGLSVISVLADMGNGEVYNAETDLKLVTGKDAAQSTPEAIVRWDAEWHWDATYTNFAKQALGGHLVLLGLKQAEQIWAESPYTVLEWAKKQNAVRGFAHMEYLNENIPTELNCCIPVDLPVEAALKNIDFVSTDVFGSYSPNYGSYFGKQSLDVYYKMLNCGIKLPLAAGTDFPCNNFEPLGTVRTYAHVSEGLSYDNWIEAIREGKTVISRLGDKEFLDLKVNGNEIPGSSIQLPEKQKINIEVIWNAENNATGEIEILCNGKVIAKAGDSATPGKPFVFKTSFEVDQSSWIAARRVSGNEYHTHTSPVYVYIGGKNIMAGKEDALYFVQWIDNILTNIADGGKWKKYFPETLVDVHKHYRQARDYYTGIINTGR
ncbi:MAG: CehA/McbA family metallohydrolase [Chitinophagaceae bacterium]|nr:CehA/McbA family metallohydrolase [Chitinophagaceae bacterium]